MSSKPGFWVAATIAALSGMGMSALALSQNSAGTTVPGSAASVNYSTPASAQAARFMKKAARDNIAEVDEGQLALEKTRNPKVKSFAKRMIRDHSHANQTLLTVARTLNVTLPARPSHKQQKHLSRLRRLSAARFDATYDRMQVKDHEKTVRQFAREEKEIQNPPLKAWVHETLPVLKQHLRLAQTLPGSSNTG